MTHLSYYQKADFILRSLCYIQTEFFLSDSYLNYFTLILKGKYDFYILCF